MNILIPILAIQAARKLLTRIRFERLKLPVLTHVLATVDAAGLTLAATDLDHWLETRLPATINPDAPARFLIPAAALTAAVRGDKKSTVRFDTSGTADDPALPVHRGRGGIQGPNCHSGPGHGGVNGGLPIGNVSHMPPASPVGGGGRFGSRQTRMIF